MGDRTRTLDIVDGAIHEALARGLVHLEAGDEQLDGRSIRIGERPTLHFASCSYLGLELDPRLKQAAIEATQRYGTQFSSSRAYVSAPLYEELESLLDSLFEAHTVVAPGTTLAHLAALPVLVAEDDAVILDVDAKGDHVLLAPPFIIEDAQVTEIVEKLARALDAALDGTSG